MARIVHIALKCRDKDSLEKSTRFYEDIFGIYQTKNKHARGHLSRHMTDGNIDLALMLYDSEDEKEAKLAGAKRLRRGRDAWASRRRACRRLAM